MTDHDSADTTIEMPSGRADRGLTLFVLIMAGEAAFFLPFLLARVFRPTVLEVFGLSNLELGTAYGVYGSVAMFAYFVGGPLADRFNPRTMLAIALLTTAAGGLLLISIPTLSTLVLLYAYWGITTIALFWAPLIKATREWGGTMAQGSAFGLLDGGRGLLAAITGSVMVALFATLLPVDPELATLQQRTGALRQVITLLLSITAGTAVLLWFVLPAMTRSPAAKPGFDLRGVARVVRMPAVWLQAAIILCAYVGFRAVDDFSLYANEVLGVNEVDAASLGTVSLWVRPVAAIAAGYLADRVGAGRMTLLSFALIATGSLILAAGVISAGLYALFVLTVVVASLGIFALRGLYFAIMKEGRIPLSVTGSAVGIVSLVGYTPDVFMGPLMGWLLDRSPGAAGHQHVFAVAAAFALLGMTASVLFQRVTRGQRAEN